MACYLSERVETPAIALDIACGSGQLTKSLSLYFDEVYGFDASPEQIAKVESQPNITYGVAQAENLPLEDNFADLICVAQALHWFDIDSFWQEAKRVGKSGGLVVAICYDLCQISESIDLVVGNFYDSLRPYWSPERALIESAYKTVSFPFEELESRSFTMEHSWDLFQFLSYVSTWSAVKSCEADNKTPMQELKNALQEAWSSAESLQEVSFPLTLRLGRLG